jgi:hypothetical protein
MSDNSDNDKIDCVTIDEENINKLSLLLNNEYINTKNNENENNTLIKIDSPDSQSEAEKLHYTIAGSILECIKNQKVPEINTNQTVLKINNINCSENSGNIIQSEAGSPGIKIELPDIKQSGINTHCNNIKKAMQIHDMLKELKIINYTGEVINLNWHDFKESKNCISINVDDCIIIDNVCIKEALTCDNIKNNKQEINKILYKMVIWYFRKIMVDSIITDLLLYYNNTDGEPIHYQSVGSNKITSDYDITLYHEIKEFKQLITYDESITDDEKIILSKKAISKIIYKYYNIIFYIFGERSDVLFDTNLYGESFIINDECLKDSSSGTNDCSNVPISVTNEIESVTSESETSQSVTSDCNDTEINNIFDTIISIINTEDYFFSKSGSRFVSSESLNIESTNTPTNIHTDTIIKTCDITCQHIWAIIKIIYNHYVTIQKDVQDDVQNYITKLKNEKLQSYIKIAYNFVEKTKGINSMTKVNELMRNYKNNNEMIGQNNYISLVNYFSPESYFTRGAFIHVVVYKQMKRKTNPGIVWTDYLNSFIENASDYVKTKKEKYKIRYQDAWNGIFNDKPDTNYKQNDKPDDINSIEKLFESIEYVFNKKYPNKKE